MVELDVVLIVVLVMLVGAVVLARRLVRFSRRQLATAAAHTAELRARVQPPGPARDAALLRTRLDAEVRATREMLRTAPKGVVFRADATALVADLDATATSLLGELSAIQAFRDIRQQRAAMAAVGPQVEQLIDTTYRARQTLLQTSASDRERELARLRAQVDLQTDALGVYRRQGGALDL